MWSLASRSSQLTLLHFDPAEASGMQRTHCAQCKQDLELLADFVAIQQKADLQRLTYNAEHNMLDV